MWCDVYDIYCTFSWNTLLNPSFSLHRVGPEGGAKQGGLWWWGLWCQSPTNILNKFYNNDDVTEIVTSSSINVAPPKFLRQQPPCSRGTYFMRPQPVVQCNPVNEDFITFGLKSLIINVFFSLSLTFSHHPHKSKIWKLYMRSCPHGQ